MGQEILRTNILILIGQLVGVAIIGVLFFVNPGFLPLEHEVGVLILFILVIYSFLLLLALLKAKILLISGDKVLLRSLYVPSNQATVPLNDLMSMHVSRLAVPFTRTVSLHASRSGDEVQTSKEISTMVHQLRDGLQSSGQQITQENKLLFKDALKKFSELTVVLSVPNVSPNNLQSKLASLQLHIDTNMQAVKSSKTLGNLN